MNDLTRDTPNNPTAGKTAVQNTEDVFYTAAHIFCPVSAEHPFGMTLHRVVEGNDTCSLF